MFNISEKAALEINRLLVEEGDTDSFLRIKVVPGGCSGFEYEMGFDDSLDDSDQIFENLNVKVVIDKFSFDHLNGGTLNFSDGINGTGFGVENPNAKATCGCGTSFTV
ncbi:iron-sulfur cluster assembly accessory protein [bacterium]|jgi:iron-sulfur cluster assembly protein|nr:iron-sulfur cluster assembly accessory protein [bacterium]MBT3850406.1 iron-sulfur cluster assembly accessory protein [bacterium]MBT4435117.1 iron-sulfur cluster assembly accessory protein [bacterium]MDG2445626.1 iron-sulfur cluster assembly accessory protein [Thermodesulfobacteriota bacterium]|tara:strand:+ start:16224 stop:16547 length:324 start_codon:yes stop_codon:yes gene_type:complete